MMNLKRNIQGLVAILMLAGVSALAQSPHRLRVEVLEHDREDFNVNVTIPLEMVRSMGPMIEDAMTEAADSVSEQERINLREIYQEFRRTGDFNWAEFNDGASHVTIKTEGDLLLINAEGPFDEESGELEYASVQIPLALLDAVFATEENIDMETIIATLESFVGQDLVKVDSSTHSVRVWVE